MQMVLMRLPLLLSFMTVGFDAVSINDTHVTSNCTATAVAAHLLAIVRNATAIC